MALQEILAGQTGLEVRTALNDMFTELYDSKITTVRGWGYQDFDAGVITTTSVILTANTNGTGITFDSTKIVSGTSVICLVSDNLKVPWTGTNTFIFSSKVTATNVADTVTLSGVPNSYWGAVRIYYLYDYVGKIPQGNLIAPKFISSQVLTELNTSFITEEELATKIQSGSTPFSGEGIKTILLTHNYSDTDFTIRAWGYDPATNNDIGVQVLRDTKTVNSFNVYVPGDCTVEWDTIKY